MNTGLPSISTTTLPSWSLILTISFLRGFCYTTLQYFSSNEPNHVAMEWNAIVNNFTLPIDAPCSISIICRSTISPPSRSGNTSSPSAEPGAILTRVKGMAINRRRPIIGPWESMNERCLIPLPLAKLVKNRPCCRLRNLAWQVDH